MALFFLLNCVLVGSRQRFAGELVDSTAESVTDIQSCGGTLGDQGNAALANASALAQALRKQGKPMAYLDGVMLGALTGDESPNPSFTLAGGDANQNVDFTLGKRAIIPSVPNTAARTYTLTTNGTGPYPLTKGTQRTLTCLDVAAFAKVIANGGGGGGNVTTLLASKLGDLQVEFDSTNWVYVGGGPT